MTLNSPPNGNSMDSLSFETHSAYSDVSTLRTPSPTEMLQYHKSYNPDVFYKGSLLHELYEQEMPPEYQQFENINWQRPTSDYPIRRATFPYVRHDQPYPPCEQHYPSRQEPYPPYHDFEDPNIKLEDAPPLIVQQRQSNFYKSPPPSCHQMAMPYLPPHSNLPVQHTDDAASKETQYLRRRCFNCHTTEPPSWRRSTLNPGKIVCNKCGLYERTHLRARPLRFDELRSGTKSRKLSKASTSPKQSKMAMIKKEPGLDRRSSVSSSSSVHSGSGASDWDDNVSLYSSGSAPTTSFNSPVSQNYPLNRDSHSPSHDGGIRLPNNPLSDVASLRHASTTACNPPQPILRKSHSSPVSYYPPPSLSEANLIPQDCFSHSQNDTSPEGALWAERTEPGMVSSPTGSL